MAYGGWRCLNSEVCWRLTPRLNRLFVCIPAPYGVLCGARGVCVRRGMSPGRALVRQEDAELRGVAV